MGNLLTKEQKKKVCIFARQVWDGLPQSRRDHFLRADGGVSNSVAYDLWRHYEQGQAVGHINLTSATNDEFCILMAHFAIISGDNNEASYWLMRCASDERRRVYYLIRSSCINGIEWPKYPQSICLAQNKCPLWQASIQQLFNILSTVRNRVTNKKKEKNQLELWGRNED